MTEITRSGFLGRGVAAAGGGALVLAGLASEGSAEANPLDVFARLRAVEDRLAIMDLNARYGDAFDNGRSDEFARMYTPDGQLVLQGATTATLSGYDQLKGLSQAIPYGTFHSFVDPHIEVQGDEATQRIDLIMTSRSAGHEPGSIAFIATGTYDDELVRTPAGWRFKKRVFTADTPLPLPGP
jgi:hypothetical protein